MVAGIIYNPITDELFAAERGRGAYLNDRRMRVAARRDLHDAVIACGIPHLGRGDHAQFRRELTHIQAKAAESGASAPRRSTSPLLQLGDSTAIGNAG